MLDSTHANADNRERKLERCVFKSHGILAADSLLKGEKAYKTEFKGEIGGRGAWILLVLMWYINYWCADQ
jgi:hypothetical protein